MPYIKDENRKKYNPLILELLEIIPYDGEVVIRAYCIGYFIDVLKHMIQFEERVVSDFLIAAPNNVGNSIYEVSSKIHKLLPTEGDKLAGEFNYVVSAVIWGVLGDSEWHSSANYCLRSLIKGAIWKIILSEEQDVLFYGVLTDIIDEMYRRQTSVYEDQKKKESGDVWPIVG